MSNFFSTLNELEQTQRSVVQNTDVSQVAQNIEQDNAQQIDQVSKELLKSSSKSMSKKPSKSLLKSSGICIQSEDVEIMAFTNRNEAMNKVSASVPIQWKRELNIVANELGVGKYNLVAYIIGDFLGKIKKSK